MPGRSDLWAAKPILREINARRVRRLVASRVGFQRGLAQIAQQPRFDYPRERLPDNTGPYGIDSGDNREFLERLDGRSLIVDGHVAKSTRTDL
jgi:hypothetical protein